MVSQYPYPELVFVEPTMPSHPGIRHWYMCYRVTNLDADAPGVVTVYFGRERPWMEARSWVKIETVIVSTWSNAADVVVSPTLTLDLNATGFTCLEQKTLKGGVGYTTAVNWNIPLLTKSQVHEQRPTFDFQFSDNAATDDYQFYFAGTFDSDPSEQPQPVVVEKIHEFPWIRRR